MCQILAKKNSTELLERRHITPMSCVIYVLSQTSEAQVLLGFGLTGENGCKTYRFISLSISLSRQQLILATFHNFLNYLIDSQALRLLVLITYSINGFFFQARQPVFIDTEKLLFEIFLLHKIWNHPHSLDAKSNKWP